METVQTTIKALWAYDPFWNQRVCWQTAEEFRQWNQRRIDEAMQAKLEDKRRRLETLGKWLYLVASGLPGRFVAIESFRDASLKLQQYRDRCDLGASDFHRDCGVIFAMDKETKIARVSYNGRIWTVRDRMLLQESAS